MINVTKTFLPPHDEYNAILKQAWDANWMTNRGVLVQELEEKLKTLEPIFKGVDHQIDTYFNVEKGRLKLREGTIENALIYYERENIGGAKQSDILLYQHLPNASLKQLLTKVHGIKAVVDKSRKIYFIENA